MKELSIDELRDTGLLQEVNRQWFHPLGLALSVVIGSETTKLEIIDGEDPEGFIFGEGVMEPEKAARFEAFRRERHAPRLAALGFIQQASAIQTNAAGAREASTEAIALSKPGHAPAAASESEPPVHRRGAENAEESYATNDTEADGAGTGAGRGREADQTAGGNAEASAIAETQKGGVMPTLPINSDPMWEFPLG